MKLFRKNPLFFALLFPAVVDSTLTLTGQRPEYWAHKVVNEASPVYYVLKVSPLLYIFGVFAWFLILYSIFKKLKEPINLFLTVFLIAGHSWGSASWIWNLASRNKLYTLDNQVSIMLVWSAAILYFVIISLFATYFIRIYFREK